MFQEKSVVWSLWSPSMSHHWLSSSILAFWVWCAECHQGNPAHGKLPQAAGERCWKLSPEPTMSESNPNSQLPSWAFCSSHRSHWDFSAWGAEGSEMCRFPWVSAQLGGHRSSCSTWHSRTLAQPWGWDPAQQGHEHRLSPRGGSQDRVMCKVSKVKSKRLCQGKKSLKEEDNIWRDFPSPCQVLPYLCLLEISSALGFQPHGTRRRLSRRLSTVTEFRCTTWKPGAIPPLCLSLQDTKPTWRSVVNRNS